MKLQSVYLELFAFLITVLTHKIYFFHSVDLERNLTTLVKENRLGLLIKSCSVDSKLLESQIL